ncbi:phospholipid phosphatase-related protein type 3 [Oncorhynchus kisutch]|uniref:Phospholipid phosphatase-related protein type 3 n=1 Tax=Oncorhynchus kisutch TaxID=8019 RepID=A0A8C7M8D9_ONCKI|nr:phospholipid phosphatase-related protein type 3-like [Oncorhynchus kisutch]XP_020354242.1 phospholipid phosphatase-related protein type 3-like [Oncorhynchus kisutch]
MMTPRDSKPKKKPPKDSLTLLPCFYFVELPIVASSMVSLYFLELTDLLQPAQVGFRCHDRMLSMPYVDGGDELIPLLMLLSLAFAGPAASIMMGEGLVYFMQSRLKIRPGVEGSINAGGCNFNSFLRRTVRFVGVHVFGLCATALMTDVIQLATGYHTPFFLTVCKPNYTQPGVACDKNPYITKDICSGHDQHAIVSARKTFPSQHATLSAFAAVYISMYFNSTISDSTKLLKPVLVFAFAIVAALTGLTQITQYRSHPIDVYVGFLIGAGIAAYLAFHAVGNFRSCDDIIIKPAPPPQKEDALRALTQRGHDSVYNKGVASASESADEIAAPPSLDRLEGMGRPLQREKASIGSLKRASVDVELLAPRSPMGQQTMVTFSNTLPRSSMNANGGLGANGGPEESMMPTQPVQRRLKAVQVPMDPMRSQQLVTEWKQKSMEMRGLSLRDEAERDASEEGSEGGEEGSEDGGPQASLYPSMVQSNRGASAGPIPVSVGPPGSARVVATPRPPHIPEAGPPPVSPKSALTRAKWLSITEKSGGGGSIRGAPNQPRIMQVIAMSKQQGLLPSSSSGGTPKSSETTSTSSCTSSTASADSPHYRPPSEAQRDSAIITVDAHAPHHPVVHGGPPPCSGNGNPWEWRGASNGSDPRDSYELNDLNRGDSVGARGSTGSFRPHQTISPCSSTGDGDPEMLPPLPLPHAEVPHDGRSRESTLRRKTALVLLERDIQFQNKSEQENYYKKIQGGRRYKD